MTTEAGKRFRLRLKRLDFISAVDAGAQGEISNVALIKRAPDEHAVEATCQVIKLDESLGLVFGWALASSIDGGKSPHVDLQGDAIDDADLIKVAAEFMSAAASSDVMHDSDPDGRIVFAMPLVPEVNAALGIQSDVHGLAIAMKPSPETFKRFQSGELRAFSIAGIGERSPLEKRADDVLAVEKAKAEKQLAEALEAKAHEERTVTEMHAWLDKMAADCGVEAASEVAQRNANSIGKWGTTWLEKRAEQRATGEATVSKALEDFAKAQRSLDALIEKYAKATKTTREAATCAVMETDAGRTAYAAIETAKRAPQTRVLKEYQPRIDKLTAEIEQEVDAFARAHDLPAAEAHARLSKVSRLFKAKDDELHQTRMEMSREHQLARIKFEREHHEEAQRAHEAEILARAERAKAARPEVEKALESHVTQIAKTRGESYGDALDWALVNDPATKALYTAARPGWRS